MESDVFALAGKLGRVEPFDPEDMNSWLLIGADNRVSVFTGKVELGQGARTALAQIVADELDIPFESVDLHMGITGLVPHDSGTHGSWTIRAMRPALQKASAEARETLLLLAVEKLGVSPDKLAAKQGFIAVKGSPGKKVTYGDLSGGKPLPHKLAAPARPKPADEYRLMGASVPKVDIKAQVTGKTVFAADMTVPGMLHGKVLRPPSYEARPVKVDVSAARSAPGVVDVVHDDDFIGVVAETETQAENALSLIKVSYSEPAYMKMEDLYTELKRKSEEGIILKETGSPEEGFKLARKMLTAEYRAAYLCHSVIEREAAIADVKPGDTKVWITTSVPFGVRRDVSALLGVPEAEVKVTPTAVGGGFGRKNVGDAAMDAAHLSRAVRRPVKVVWSRQEDFTWAPFRSAEVAEEKAGLDKDGRISAWEYHVYSGPYVGSGRKRYGLPAEGGRERGGGGRPRPDNTVGGTARGIDPMYSVPHQTIAAHLSQSPLRTASLRALGATMNCFAHECFMDELAEAAATDPVEFRLKHLTADDSNLREVIQAAAKKAGWRPHKGPSGRGIGFACGLDSDAWIAEVAEVDVDRSTGKVKVKRVVAAMDCGLAINPDTVLSQIEGSIVMGCSSSLNEAILFDKGRILTDSFLDYPIFTFAEGPVIEAVVMDKPHDISHGAGEPAFIPVPAAISNAIYDAVGVRLREIPITPEKVWRALSSKAAAR